MANIVAIQLEVDAGKSVQEVQNLEEAIKDIQKTTNIDNVEDKFNGLNHSIENGVSSVEGLRKAIKSYQTIALTAGRESPIGKEALLRASKLTDELVDLDNEVKRLSMDGQQMQAALQLGTAVTSGYQAFAGVTALVGEENEDLMKTMVKLQAIQSVFQGTEQVRLAFEKESILMLNLRNAKTKIATVLQKAYAFSVGMGSKAMKLFRLALISTGLGALVVLMGSLISKWDDWKDTIMSIIKVAFYPLIKVLEYLGVIESDLDKQRRIANEAYLSQLKEQQEGMEELGKKINERYDHEIRMAKIAGKDTFEIEKQKLKDTLNRIDEESKALVKIALLELKLNGEVSEEKKAEYKERMKELEDLKVQSDRALEVLDAEHNKKLLEQEEKDRKEKEANYKRWRDKKKAQLKKEQDRDLKELEDHDKLMLELERHYQDLLIANIYDNDQRALAELRLKQEREKADLITKFGEDTELLKQLRIKQVNELRALEDRINQENKEFEENNLPHRDKPLIEDSPEIKAYKETLDYKRTLLEENLKSGLISEQEYSEGVTEIYKVQHQARVKLLDSTADLFTNLQGLMSENEKAQKGFALAQIGIDTAKAISSLVAASEGNPLNLLTGGAAGILQFTSGFARILGSMKQAYGILKAGSSVSAPSISTSTSTGSTSTSTTGTQNTGTTNFATPTSRVYLVESDVQEMRERRENIEAVSTI